MPTLLRIPPAEIVPAKKRLSVVRFDMGFRLLMKSVLGNKHAGMAG